MSEAGDLLAAVAPSAEKKAAAKKYVTFTTEEWDQIETFFGQKVQANELKAFVLAMGSGKVAVGLA